MGHNGSGKSLACDVTICGGGLAGQTLARQLRLSNPSLSIIVIDALARPLPESAFKVGESTTEVGAFYLAHVLNLVDYFESKHITKLGFRFFFGDSTRAFDQRPEFGLSRYPSVISTYQFDRGNLENDLRQFNLETGVVLLEGWNVSGIELGSGGDRHRISVKNVANREAIDIECRWVVDAMGRRRFLQRKLGLTIDQKAQCSAAWFRFDHRVDISDLVPATKVAWHNRVSEERYYSTNHLVGHGYWVWLIPLSTGGTSIGIVTREDIHPPAEYRTYDLAIDWLSKHEPALGAYLQNREPLDFRWIHKYSYSSKKLFSAERWSCVGEAGVFADPLYAPGTDLIAFGNTITSRMIELDMNNSLDQNSVDRYNLFMRAFNDVATDYIQRGYELFAKPNVAATKVIWDTAVAWALVCPQMFNFIFIDFEKQTIARKEASHFFELTQRMQGLFIEWGNMPKGRLKFDFIDFLKIPMLRGLRSRNMHPNKTLSELTDDYRANMRELEELAQAVFRLAVSDVLPAERSRIADRNWLKVSAFSLRPDRWEGDGLFEPTTPAGDATELTKSLMQFFQIEHVYS